VNVKPGIKLLSEIEGVGVPAMKGDRIVVRLNGWLTKGEPIQENFNAENLIGSRVVIPGIEYSVEGMRPGGKRKVKISPHLAYKDVGVPGLIPPNAVLIYEIEVLSVASDT
jgi:FKBP-type peptidyl-prolyl cis-trans isomerase